MGARRIAAVALAGALVAGGTGAAIAAVTKDDGEHAEQELLADAAKRLDVTPQKLRDALTAAQDAQLDEAVKDGKLTQEQAGAMKAARKQSGRLLGPLRGPRLHKPFAPGRGRAGRHLRHGLLADVAKALGTTQAKLMDALRDGTSLAEIAKDNDTSVAAVRAAVRSAVKTRLDKAVKDGDLTQEQADTMLDRVGDRLEAIASGRPLRLHRHGRRAAPHRAPPGGSMRPGRLLPGAGAPELVGPRDPQLTTRNNRRAGQARPLGGARIGASAARAR